MRFVGVRELRQRMSELLQAVRRDREALVLTYRGKPFGAILPLEEEDLEDLILAYHPEFRRAWEEARCEIDRGEYLTLKEVQELYSQK